MNLILGVGRLDVQPAVRAAQRLRRSLGFSKTTTLGRWSADILVRSRSSVHPEADKNVQCR